MSESFFGKYRGKVTDINDPLQQGRIRARVPDVLGNDKESGWALPCFPIAGSGMGFFGLPKVGSGVWMEFEHGDPDYPIWSGCWYGDTSEVPPTLLAPPYRKLLIKTTGGQSMLLDDTPGTGGITLETSGGQKVTILGTSIEIDSGPAPKAAVEAPQIELVRNATHPVVFGDNLLQYLAQLVMVFNAHMHPGEMALGAFPVTPAPPVPPLPPPTPALLSMRVRTG